MTAKIEEIAKEESKVVITELEAECPAHYKETRFKLERRDGKYICDYAHCQKEFTYDEIVRYNTRGERE